MSKKHHVLSLIFALLIIGILIAIGIYLYLNWQLYGPIFTSRERFHEYIQGFGIWAPLVFLLIQVLQVIITPIPAGVTTMMGGIMFGALWGSILSCVGVIAGSMLAFFLARRLGQSFVIKMAGQKNFKKYNTIFSGRFSLTLLLLFLIPFFPDDILCLLAGLSALSARTFFILLVIGRIPGALGMTLIGSGLLIFSLEIWMVLGVVSVVAILVFLKYRVQIEAWIHQKILYPGQHLQEQD